MAERLASFRGVPFHLASHERSTGRRKVLHEFPQRADPEEEDLGLGPDEFTLEGFAIGDDHARQAERLEAACNRKGSGTLVHPWRGIFEVTCRSFRERETSQERRITRFALELVRVGRAEGSLLTDRDPESEAEQARAAVEAAQEAAWGDDLAAAVVASGKPAPAAGAAPNLAQRVLDGFDRGVLEVYDRLAGLDYTTKTNSSSDLAGRIADLLIAEPQDLPGAVGTIARDLYSNLGEGGYALGVLAGLAEGDPVVPGGSSPLEKAATTIEAAAVDLLRVGAAGAGVVAGAGFDWPSLDDARAYAERIADALDGLEEGLSDELFDAVRRLRSALRAAVPPPDADLPRVAVVTLEESLPALVLAHRLYGSPDRADELVARNHLPHPAFVPVIRALEVLVEVEA